MNVFVQPANDPLEAMATLDGFFPLGQYLEEYFRALPAQFHITQLINAEQIDPAVADDDPGL